MDSHFLGKKPEWSSVAAHLGCLGLSAASQYAREFCFGFSKPPSAHSENIITSIFVERRKETPGQ
jgi:hypothetical protein